MKLLNERKINWTPFLLFLPVLLLISVFAVIPMGHLIKVSLHRTSYLKTLDFVGLRNYIRVLGDSEILKSIFISVKYIAGTIIFAVPIGLVLAIILNRPLKFNGLFRAILILPYAISQVASALLWVWLLEPSYGPLNYIIRTMGFSAINFLGNPQLALKVLILVNTWMSFPFAMVMFLSALETIPHDLIEAAYLDGASKLAAFRYVSFPFILNTLLVIIIMLTLRAFNMVTLIFVMTGGGPIGTTNALSLTIYYEAFFNFRMARAAVLGVVMFALNMIFATAYIAVIKREAIY